MRPLLPSVGLIALLAATNAACSSLDTRVKVPELKLPASFDGKSVGPSGARIKWKDFFADEHLHALIAAALRDNVNVNVALQRIEIARAGVKQATGALLPQVSAVAGMGVRKASRYTSEGAGNLATEITPGQPVPTHVGDFTIGLQSTWEADLWRKLPLKNAARARYLATVEGTRLVVTTVVADVASAYFELLALDHVQDLLAETLTRQTQAVEMMRIQKEAGRANELAVQQFEAQLARVRALVADTARRSRELENGLNLLVGRVPERITRSKDALFRESRTLSVGVPSELLRQRPDIREAELAVEAAKLDLEAARAAFFPRLTLSAGVGYQAFNPKFLFATPESLIYSLSLGLVAPLVNRSGIEAEFSTAKALQVQAMYEFQGAILRAFVEVKSGLAAIEHIAETVAQKRAQKAALASAVASADALFRAGKASYLDVLVAQQSALEVELELIEAARDQRIAVVRLYQALGGGWDERVSPTER